jgi:hypothetical protein
MSEQSRIDAINNILELLNEKYGRNSNSCSLQMDQPQPQQQQQQQQQQPSACDASEIRDPHGILKTLNLMRSRL